ncbi:hypothetical protein SCA50_0366 [Salmonella enterica subsp. enterica serovar Choleraesuis str. SCSA50]|uniref:Uncharacterized protein n=2 Tax=Salmonella enterica subsp. enterica serovar Choleraesuis TaxID=119912 RepID=Q57SR2_SALCH|nr:hypothetical protein SCH_0343 [Salmonella enterica subsp. enterica serovar Choleraesuis str. SC-B67]EFZ04940.1 hypothetical protein SCA50_0366 [Salmonella enterica subsp. enterica serovar Choleraesuis str. SCSA50]
MPVACYILRTLPLLCSLVHNFDWGQSSRFPRAFSKPPDIPQVSRVVEGFYVRFFGDWLGFISGAFRWKVFAVFADDVGDTSSLSRHTSSFSCGSGNTHVGVLSHRRHHRFQ